MAVVRCETDSDGGIEVRNSSVTSATGVTVRRGDKVRRSDIGVAPGGFEVVVRPNNDDQLNGQPNEFRIRFPR